VRHGTFRDCIEDKQESSATHNRKYDPVEPLVVLVQAL
jgi:hypothetical protein